MAHHGDDSEAMAAMRKIFAEQMGWARGLQRDTGNLNLGPTGQFPEGKLNENDEGEIRIAIISQNGKVVIDFGKPTAWIGFTPEQARGIAESLVAHADHIDQKGQNKKAAD